MRTEESENLANLAKLAEQLSSSSPQKKSSESSSGVKKKDPPKYPLSSSSFSSGIKKEKIKEEEEEDNVIIKDISYKTGMISDKIIKGEKEEKKGFTATDIGKRMNRNDK